MSRIDDILLRARDSLADHGKQRWSDDRLLRLVDEAHKDVARQTKLLKDETQLQLVEGQHTYDLPDDVWLITRASVDGCLISLVSYDQLDEQSFKLAVNKDVLHNSIERYNSYNADYGRTCWETVEGPKVECLVYDRRDMDRIRVYPIPDDTIPQTQYTFENAGTILFVGDEVFGVVVDIDNYTFATVFGVTTALYEPAIATELFDSEFGVVTSISESAAHVHIWYIKTPDTITATTDPIQTPTMFDTALRLYVVGNAYLDDNDAAYRQKGMDTLALYERELVVAKDASAKDGVRNPANLRSSYRGPFE